MIRCLLSRIVFSMLIMGSITFMSNSYARIDPKKILATGYSKISKDEFKEYLFELVTASDGAISESNLTYLEQVIRLVKDPELLSTSINNEGETLLTKLITAKKGPVSAMVTRLLEAGASPNSANKDLVVPLQVALREKRQGVVNKLISYGADITHTDNRGATPLHGAAEYGLLKSVKRLLKKGADAGALDRLKETPLHKVLRSYVSNTDAEKKELYLLIIQILLVTKSAKPHLPNDQGQLPLMIGIMHELPKQITDLLINYGALLDEKDPSAGLTPLEYAVTYDRKELAEYLLNRGADAGYHSSSFFSPLSLAVSQESVPLTKLLLQYGAPVDFPVGPHKRTPLHYAAELGHTELILLLLDYGAFINACTRDGKTPLLLVRKSKEARKRTNIVKLTELLIKKGALSYNCSVSHDEL